MTTTPDELPAVPEAAAPWVLGIHHVALAVPDLDAAIAQWSGLLGARVLLRDVVASQGVEAAALAFGEGVTELELVAPASGELGAGSGIAKYLERSGPGLHHVAWSVRDCAAALAGLARAGVRVIDEVPRPGLHGTPVAFVHPRSTGGVLVELVEVPAA